MARREQMFNGSSDSLSGVVRSNKVWPTDRGVNGSRRCCSVCSCCSSVTIVLTIVAKDNLRTWSTAAWEHWSPWAGHGSDCSLWHRYWGYSISLTSQRQKDPNLKVWVKHSLGHSHMVYKTAPVRHRSFFHTCLLDIPIPCLDSQDCFLGIFLRAFVPISQNISLINF